MKRRIGVSVALLFVSAGALQARAAELLVLTSGSDVRRYDAASGAFLGVPASAFRAQGLDVDSAGRIYLASHGFAQLYRVDPATGNTVTGPQIPRPFNPRLGPDGLLYVNYTDGVVRRHSAADLSVVDTFLPAGTATVDIHFGPDGRLWANDINAIRSFDPKTGAETDFDPATPQVQPFATLLGSRDFTFAPDGDVLVLLDRGVVRYDSVSRVGTPFIAAPAVDQPSPTSLAIGPDANLYVSTTGNQVLRYDGTTGAFLGTFISDTSLDQPVELRFVVPEPGALAWVGCAGMAALVRRRR